jgi:hypothetical protein
MLRNLTFLGLPSYQHMFLGAIVVILAVPLLVNLPEARVAVPALAPLFVLGFVGPFLNAAGHLTLVVIGLAISSLHPIAVGRFARSGGTAFAASAGLVALAWLATGYGIYFARETGWHGLTDISHPTDDVTGIGVIWFVFIGTLPISIGAAVVAGFVSAWANPLGHPAATPPQPN